MKYNRVYYLGYVIRPYIIIYVYLILDEDVKILRTSPRKFLFLVSLKKKEGKRLVPVLNFLF